MASRKWLERIARNRNVVVGILSRLRLRNGLGFPVLEVLELPINKVTALHYAREACGRARYFATRLPGLSPYLLTGSR